MKLHYICPEIFCFVLFHSKFDILNSSMLQVFLFDNDSEGG